MTVRIVASCTERKRASVRQDLRLRAFSEPDLAARAQQWLAALEGSPALAKPARELYGGEHWKLVLEIEDQIRAHGDIDLYVASAGYGLVSADSALKPYSATFATGQPDSVTRRSTDDPRDWWDTLCSSGPAPTSLQQLATRAESLVVIASAKYLRAMLPDVLRARDALTSDRLIVFSGSDLPQLGPSLIRVDDRVQVALKKDPTSDQVRGTKQGLAARTAKHLLNGARDWPPRASELAQAYSELVTGVERPPPLNRTRHEDEPILTFIRNALDENPRAGWTRLLKAWRASGQACEQKRFRRLHAAVREQRS